MNDASTAITAFFRRLRYSAGIDPVRDWLVVLIASGIVLIAIIVWNVWAFDTVANGGAIGASTSTNIPAFNHASLDAVHAAFEDRAAEEAKYITGVYRYADPSQ